MKTEASRAKIHSTAVIHPGAKLGEGVEVGPYAVIDENVAIGAQTKIGPHAVLTGWTEIGPENQIGVGAVIGLEPQDMAYKNEKSFVKIGRKNIIREYVQIHRGTKEGSATVLGDKNFLLGFSHVAHNCKIGNGTILANGTLLAGYVEVEDFVFISGHGMVHQFCRVGKLAMMRGGSRVSLDIPPYTVADDANSIRGINTVGLERHGFSADQIRQVKKVYRDVFGSGKPLNQEIEDQLALNPAPEIRHFLEFIKGSPRGVCRPAKS